MTLVALAAGAIGLSTARAVSNRRFEASVDAIASRLNLAQELMICRDADFTVHLTPTSVHLTPAQLPPLRLTNIASLSHHTLHFPAHRRHELPHGTLTLTSTRGRTATISLPGYPTRIARS